MESSVAAGVAAVMAAPIGSVFFSMELTATFYMVNNLIFSLYCGFLSSFFLLGYRLLGLTETVHSTNIPSEYNNYDLIEWLRAELDETTDKNTWASIKKIVEPAGFTF